MIAGSPAPGRGGSSAPRAGTLWRSSFTSTRYTGSFTAIAPIFSGAVDGKGNEFYASFPFDSGHNSADSSF